MIFDFYSFRSLHFVSHLIICVYRLTLGQCARGVCAWFATALDGHWSRTEYIYLERKHRNKNKQKTKKLV